MDFYYNVHTLTKCYCQVPQNVYATSNLGTIYFKDWYSSKWRVYKAINSLAQRHGKHTVIHTIKWPCKIHKEVKDTWCSCLLSIKTKFNQLTS